MITIYHNGACSKCRGALEILQEKNIPHQIRWYLAEPLDEAELRVLLALLNMPAADLVRRSEPLYKEQFEGVLLSEDAWITTLTQNPVLIERPIVVLGSRAIVCRPPERLFELL